MEIVITERNGWSKRVTVEKSIIRIGGDVSNDIQVESAIIAPLHLQIYHSNESTSRVLNLADALTIKSGGISTELLPLIPLEIRDGDEIEIGEVQLLFRLPPSSGMVRTSKVIEANLTFGDSVLRPYMPAVGLLTVKNKGHKDASQFQVTISGMPSDCYQVDPLPLMYPGAQEDIRIRLFHKIIQPQAGPVSMVVVISAPESYPGEEVLLQQKIYVEPVFKQVLEIKDDVETPESQTGSSAAQMQPLNQHNAESLPIAMINTGGFEQTMPIVLPLAPAEQQAPTAAVPSARTAKGSPAAQEFDLSKLKIVHGPSDEFWDE